MNALNSSSVQSLTSALDELGISDDWFGRRCLPEYQEAKELVVAEIDTDGREHQLAPECAAAWQQIKFAAATAGIDLRIASGFRSIQRQQEIIRAKMLAGESLDSILAVSAPPGFSEHHTGYALDIKTPGTKSLHIDFENSAAFQWLSQHATSYGFTITYPPGNPQGFQYEPWHWRYQTKNTPGTAK